MAHWSTTLPRQSVTECIRSITTLYTLPFIRRPSVTNLVGLETINNCDKFWIIWNSHTGGLYRCHGTLPVVFRKKTISVSKQYNNRNIDRFLMFFFSFYIGYVFLRFFFFFLLYIYILPPPSCSLYIPLYYVTRLYRKLINIADLEKRRAASGAGETAAGNSLKAVPTAVTWLYER